MQQYEWRNLVDPSQRDRCSVKFRKTGLLACGTQTNDRYFSSWILDVGSNWVTSRLHVEVQGSNWSRGLDLRRRANGNWIADTTMHGNQPDDLELPGMNDNVDLTCAVDVDLGKCPLTNTMPIRRLNLLSAGVPRTALMMAWVDMPSLKVIASDQYYSSIDPCQVRYASGTRNVDVVLSVDGEGVVTNYPDLAIRTE